MEYGNLFGAARAENDRLLGTAFVETTEFKNLAYTNDFHIAVGRRGTGKSAIFLKLRETVKRQSTILIESSADEASTLEIGETLRSLSEKYEHVRAASKLLWKASILAHIASEIVFKLHAHIPKNQEWVTLHLSGLHLHQQKSSIYSTAVLMLRAAQKKSLPDLLHSISSSAQIQTLQTFVGDWLNANNKKAMVLVDRLDEGWAAEPPSTGVLGGLAIAAVELAEAYCPIHVLAFVRDNMFRALAHFDPDFSRNIEDTSLRLNWTEDSLFSVVVERIKVGLNIPEDKEVKIWDRFAQNELKGKAGFRELLKYTLYRPRDILILLNKTYNSARANGRTHIILSDVEGASLAISQKRVEDLVKEYDQVLPGTSAFVAAFRGKTSPMTYGETLAILSEAGINSSGEATHSIAVLGSAEEVFLALHGIGFLGAETVNSEFAFCHDGTQATAGALTSARRVAVHPCYVKALDIKTGGVSVEIAELVEDEGPASEESAGSGRPEVATGAKSKLQDQRSRQLGKVLIDFTQIEPGAHHAAQFEQWLTRAIKVLFSESIINIELHPNKSNALRRDIVGTNQATSAFWRRMREDYGCRQVVFEAKNYSELGPHEFNQAVAYGGGAYGRASFIVSRGDKGLDDNERAHIKSRYYGSQHLIIILPAELVLQCLRKQRSRRRADYTEETLGRLLDTYERQYLGEKSGRKRRKR